MSRMSELSAEQEQRDREMEAAWQQHDLMERRRQLQDVILRVRYGCSTDQDANLLEQELGLIDEPEQPRDY